MAEPSKKLVKSVVSSFFSRSTSSDVEQDICIKKLLHLNMSNNLSKEDGTVTQDEAVSSLLKVIRYVNDHQLPRDHQNFLWDILKEIFYHTEAKIYADDGDDDGDDDGLQNEVHSPVLDLNQPGSLVEIDNKGMESDIESMCVEAEKLADHNYNKPFDQPDTQSFIPEIDDQSTQWIAFSRCHGEQILASQEQSSNHVVLEATNENVLVESLVNSEGFGTDDRSYFITAEDIVTDSVHIPDISSEDKAKRQKPTYQCRFCCKCLTSSGGLKLHERLHTGEKPLKCEECGQAFAQRTSLKRHMMVHTGIKPHSCDVCFRTYATRNDAARHRRTHTGEKPYSCPFCQQKFSDSSTLRKHKRRKHQVPSNTASDYRPKTDLNSKKRKKSVKSRTTVQCEYCGKCFHQKSNLKVHERIHTNYRPYECTVCGKSFSQKCQLEKQHMLIHTGVKPYACDICGKTYARRGQVSRHRRTHTGEKPYLCPFCLRHFSDASTVRKHKKSCSQQHRGEGSMETLIETSSAAPTKSNGAQNAEMLHNSNEQVYDEAPSYAELSLIDVPEVPSSLPVVYELHTDEGFHISSRNEEPLSTEPPNVNMCNRIGLSNETAQGNTHNVKRPHKCTYCGKGFNRPSHLLIHERIHTNSRPFECSVCGKAFRRKSDLDNQHMLLHTGEKPYACEVCGQSFKHRGQIAKHRRTHAGEEPFSCEICHQRYADAGSLRRHKTNCEHKQRMDGSRESFIETSCASPHSLNDAQNVEMLLNSSEQLPLGECLIDEMQYVEVSEMSLGLLYEVNTEDDIEMSNLHMEPCDLQTDHTHY